jgi:uncharacterized Fe-S cluster-containing radical SAM superfamily protein
MSKVNQKLIDTDKFSAGLRAKSLDPVNKRLLISGFHQTEQEKDLSEPPNCNGYGRVRHFRRQVSSGWPANPLPIDPACKALGLAHADTIRAQAFQIAACNWRCWYCFVPFELLSANIKFADWLSPSELIDLYFDQPDPPQMIDLTGGQPDLVPEWVPWMMEEVHERGFSKKIYLWSDDNLSNDYFWRFLTEREREAVATYPKYGRVCCFKGFNAESFSFNTLAEPALFERQFELMGRLLDTGIDLYAYATFTTPSSTSIADDMRCFVDRLQRLHENLPLRMIPLEIQVFTPVRRRLDELKGAALKYQQIAIEAWQRVLEDRFPYENRLMAAIDISSVPLHQRYKS